MVQKGSPKRKPWKEVLFSIKEGKKRATEKNVTLDEEECWEQSHVEIPWSKCIMMVIEFEAFIVESCTR